MARKYELRQRAEAQAETRRRIVEATVALHGSVGPAATTVSAIAERAGVQRLTVYRHFPDERALFRACSGHWAAVHPLPDPSAWSAVDDPAARLELALAELYAHYGETEQMNANIRRDLPIVPAIQEIAASRAPYWESLHPALLRGWNVRGRRRRRLDAVIGHAVDFETWRSLTRRQGVGDEEAVALMVALARAVTS
jgi:AcrR family transcriptional regulator